MLSESAELSRVVGDVYDAAVDPGRWPGALASACAFVGGDQSVVYWHDATTDGVDALYRYNDDPAFTKLYMEQYAALNPVFPAAFFRDVGSVTAASDLVPAPEMQQTRFYKEWMAPQGMTDSLTAILEKEIARAAFFAIQWKDGIPPDAARARMMLLVPHFQRAVAIGRLFVQHKAKESLLTETLDRIDDGVFLLDADARIVFANARAQAMLAEATLLRASNGLLRAVASEPDRALRESLRALTEAAASAGARGISVALSDAPDGRWVAHVLPLRDGVRRRAGAQGEAVAAVFVRSATSADPTPLETLAQNHKLTASEIRVVEAMLRISGLDALAEALGISRATVKTHINRVYRKCGVKNQSDLIRLVAGMGQGR